MKTRNLTSCLSLLFYAHLQATTYYISPTGNDSNSGTVLSSPFASLQKANSVVQPGDVVYLRGGTYLPNNSHVTYVNASANVVPETAALYAVVARLSTSGTASAPIRYLNYPNEVPVLDFSGITIQKRITGILVTGSWIQLKGLELKNVPCNLSITDTQCEVVRNTGSHNTYELLKMHHSEAVGFYLTKGSNNLVLNCDAYNLWDQTSGAQKGENSDGFGIHPAAGGTGNVVRGCRAWFCADDGYDVITAFEAVIIENCWAFYNGYSTGYANLANGNGFKGGGYGLAPTRLPSVIPNHTIRQCLAVGNRTNGFYANHHPGGTNWYNNTAYDNAINYNMLSSTVSGTLGNYVITDCPGYNIQLKNNLAFYSTNSNTHIHSTGTHLTNLNTASGSISHNSFNMNSVSVSGADFQSLNLTQLTNPRASDGSLPAISCLHLATGSDLINAGVAINGISFNGSAPDLGCFETNTVKSAELIGEESVPGMTVFPNPGQTEIHLEGLAETAIITFYDTSGNIALSTQSTTINVSELPTGMYFIRCANETIKWVKN